MGRATDQGDQHQSVVRQLLALETALLDQKMRIGRDRMAELLADDFFEFGSSGRIWTKAATLEGLAAGHSAEAVVRTVTDFAVRHLADEVALVTYAVSRHEAGAEVQTLRSSIWKREKENWRMVFHQGTRRRGEVEG